MRLLTIGAWLVSAFAGVALDGCGNCDAEAICGSLEGYAAYDSQGKLAPSKMCGVTAALGRSLGGGACGMNVQWDTPAGMCSCDAVEPCSGFGQYQWKNCRFNGTAASGDMATPSMTGSGGPDMGGTDMAAASGGVSCGGTVSGCGSGPPKLICHSPASCQCTGSVPSCVGGSYECWCNGPTNGMTCTNQTDCCCRNGVASCTPGGC